MPNDLAPADILDALADLDPEYARRDQATRAHALLDAASRALAAIEAVYAAWTETPVERAA